MANDYFYKGELVVLTATFTVKVTGALVDPTTVTLKVKDPAASITQYTYAGSTVTKDSTGVYHVDVNANQVGVWSYQWASTGTNQAAVEGSFEVKASAF